LNKLNSKIAPQWFITGLLAFLVAFPWVLSFSWGVNPNTLRHLISAACFALFLLVGARAARSVSLHLLARTVAVAWLVAALLSSAMALLQYFGLVDDTLCGWINRTTAGIAYANLRQRNQFASLTSIGLLSLLFLTQGAPTKAWIHLTRWRTAATVAAMLLLAWGNAASSSRTGALQWLLIAALPLIWDRQSGHHPLCRWSVLALGLYLAANLLLPWMLQAHTSQVPLSALERFNENAGSQSRTVLWANVLELIREKPWLGWGWGELKYAHFIHPYAGERFNDILDNAHNLPLHLAVTLGVPVALMLCGAVLVLTLHARPWGEQNATRQLAWGVLMVMGVHSLLEYPLWYGPFQVAAALALGMLGGRKWMQWPGLLQLATGFAGVMMASTAYATWDYWRVSQLYISPPQRAAIYQEDTLGKVRGSVLFRDEVQFAYVTTTPVTPETAETLYAAALELLHFSPEPKVTAVFLESAGQLGRESPLSEHIRRQQLTANP
jgi:O-antigen ligase